MSTSTINRKTPSARYLELVRQFPLRPIHSKADAAAATAILDRLFPGAEQDRVDSGERDYLHVLANLLATYEDANDPDSINAMAAAEKTTSLELLQFLMANTGMTQARLAEIIRVGAGAASMILKGQRSITAEHARALGRHFKLDPGVFIR